MLLTVLILSLIATAIIGKASFGEDTGYDDNWQCVCQQAETSEQAGRSRMTTCCLMMASH